MYRSRSKIRNLTDYLTFSATLPILCKNKNVCLPIFATITNHMWSALPKYKS
jgi:hypothetical protein